MTTTIGQRLISLEEAREQMFAGLDPLPAEEVPLADALGRVLAADLCSRLTLPPWDNSAMDGFAVRAADVAGASRTSPVELPVVGEARAGHATPAAIEATKAMRILTGAPLPKGADAVVPVENTDAAQGVADLPSSVSIYSAVSVGAFVRRAGSDLRAGYPLLSAGSELTPAALAVLAAGGYAEAPVHLRPTVGIIATGDELVPAGVNPGPAQIPDSNSVGLAAAARDAGAHVIAFGIAPDSVDAVVARLREAIESADVVCVSGGVSVGAHDVVKDAFGVVGRVDLWRVAIQPGKPLAFGRTPATAREHPVLLFGLPGNPVSSLVTFELFVRPVLRRLAGRADVLGRQTVRAVLAEKVTKSAGRRAFLRVNLEQMDDGAWRAHLAGAQDSHVLSALAQADGLAVIPEDEDGLPAGTDVEVIRLR
jgi:molybdopterin molybdotransferase